MNKGEKTKTRILEKAMSYASIYGLSSVTIGEISRVTDLSRTGVISHFQDKEDMQISIVKFVEKKYVENVVFKSQHVNSLERLRRYFKFWREWIDKLESEFDGGTCPFIKGLIEYQDRENSEVQKYIMNQQRVLIQYISKLVKRCMDDGHFHKDVDPEQFAFQTYSYYFGYNVFRSLHDKERAKGHSQAAVNILIENSLV